MTAVRYTPPALTRQPIHSMSTISTNSTSLFSSRKRRSPATWLSADPTTKRVRAWENVQCGLPAALLKLGRNSRVRKKRALDKLKTTTEYEEMSMEARSAAEQEIVRIEEARRHAEEQQASDEWKRLNSDSDDGDEDVDSETSGEPESDVSDPEYEVPEYVASHGGIEHEFDEDGKPKLSSDDIAKFTNIIQRARESFEGFIHRVQQRYTENDPIWEPESSSDSDGSESSCSIDTEDMEEEEEWTGIPDD